MITFIWEVRRFMIKVSEDNLSVYAAYATFFTIIAVFPFLMLILTLIQFLPVSPSVLISSLSKIMPDAFYPLLESIVDNLYNNSTGTIISVTAIAALWSSSRGMLGVFRGLNSVYHTKEKRNYIMQRLLTTFYTLMFLIVVTVTLVLLVFGNRLQLILSSHIPALNDFSSLIVFIRTIFTILLLAVFFMIMYQVFPDRKARFIDQAPGAFAASLGWMLFSFAFSIYIDNFGNYSYMYGSLTTIVLLMLWLYFCMNILLLGGELNSFLQERDKLCT